jgi:glucose-1-phosphate thymidylyltransferase
VVAIAKKYQTKCERRIRDPDVNKAYLEQGKLRWVLVVELHGWILGTFNSLMQAGQFVQVIEERQGFKSGLHRRDRLATRY